MSFLSSVKHKSRCFTCMCHWFWARLSANTLC